MQKLRTRWLAGILAMVPFACTQGPRSIQAFSGLTMGSSYEVKFVARKPVVEVQRIVEKELLAFDLAFSNWRSGSEIARVNAHASTEPLPISERFSGVMQQALLVAAATKGAFDPTMKPISDLYRLAKKHPESGLDVAKLQKARESVGYQFVQIKNGTLIKERLGLQIDLDGIVAGAAADAIGALLLQAGIASFYLQITGEVLCHGVKPDGAAWRIGVVDPDSDAAGGESPVATLALRDRALCSSGDYRNAAMVGGHVVHHLFDPRTGSNPEHATVSASVIADSCAIADALGTALMVLGAEDGALAWPAMKGLGACGALLLTPGVGTTWQEVKIEWPSEDS